MELSADAADFAARTADIPDTLGGGELDPNGLSETGNEAAQPAPGGLTPEAIAATLRQISLMVAKAVKGGEFWEFSEPEAKNLADVWHPILAPIWARWLSETDGNLLPALMVTTMSLLPRLGLEAARRASLTASTATAKSGDSQPSSDLPDPVNPQKPTD